MSSWTKMTAAQRSAEMKKRQKVAKRNKKKKALTLVQDKERNGELATEVQNDSTLGQDTVYFAEGYIIGRTEAAAEAYAQRLCVSLGFAEDHSTRIIELLHAKWTRGIAPVPQMRGTP